MSSTSATDIITYIGIPLAVLGVLPILYTFVLSILTQRRIRHLLLSHGHKPASGRNGRQEGFVLRASPMTSLIEVEMPRYTVAPLARTDQRYWNVSEEVEKYHGEESKRALLSEHNEQGEGRGYRQREADEEQYAVVRAESTLEMIQEGRVRGFLRGGSWRTFHWRRLVVGRKLYRIQYEDELREPPAEIDFADLVNFLMDWGADLDSVGWEKLRGGGLWTPAGTVLLRAAADEDLNEETMKTGGQNAGGWVLRTSMPDDSDGVLTLCCRWPEGHFSGGRRNAASLPPGWGRLHKPGCASDSVNEDGLITNIVKLTEDNKLLLDVTSLRFKAESGLISTAYPETSGKETGTTIELFRMSKYTLGQQWFTSATSALLTLTRTNGQLWGYETPNEIISFVRKDSIPCGVLVLLDLLSPDAAPHWDNSGNDDKTQYQLAMAHMNRAQARLQAERLEASMPPDQARVHKMNRQANERQEQMNDVNRNTDARRAREQRRLQDAIASPRLSCKAVAESCLAWLIKAKFVQPGSTIESAAEAVLFLLVLESQQSEEKGDLVMPIMMIIEEWTNWTVAGGMKKEQFEMLQQHRRSFCYAACLVAVVAEAALVTTGKGKASIDMIECLRLWKKVRLG